MKTCVVCGRDHPEVAMYSDTWCHKCVEATLDEQHREDTHKIKPQVFHT